jgi:ubiquinone/menaquinone biosynthesis C-methylase UbiE
LIAGHALNLAFCDDSFDFVIETGAFHHVQAPFEAVKEMTRVARKGVMISDNNNIGECGSPLRLVKFAIKSLVLWPASVYFETRGKMYKWSEGDGVFYSFSALDCVDAMKDKFPMVHYMNTVPSNGLDLYRGATHVRIFACKE